MRNCKAQKRRPTRRYSGRSAARPAAEPERYVKEILRRKKMVYVVEVRSIVILYFSAIFIQLSACEDKDKESIGDFCANIANKWGELLECPGVNADIWLSREETLENCYKQVRCWKDIVSSSCLQSRMEYDKCLVTGGCAVIHYLTMPECSEESNARWEICTEDEMSRMHECLFLYCLYTRPDYTIPPEE